MTAAILALVAALAALANPAPRDSLADLPRGEPPRIGYVDHGTFRGADGRTVNVPDRHGISSVTPYDGGFLITDTRYFEGSVGLVQIDAAGRTTGGWTTSDPPAVADDGQVAWSSFTPPETGLLLPSVVHVGSCPRAWPGHRPFAVAGFVGDQVVVNQGLDVSLLDEAGEVRALPRLEYAFDAADGLVAGQLERGVGVLDVAGREVLWRARGYGLTFSPSGRRVAMTDRDGVVVRSAPDGKVEWRSDLPGHASSVTWEDERHLLTVATMRGRTAILRLGPDEHVERATTVSRYDPSRPPFVLSTR